MDKAADMDAEKAARMEKAAKLRAEMDVGRRVREEYMRRRGLVSVPGSIYIDRTNCDTVDIDLESFMGLNRSVDKKEFLAIEKLFWGAAMAYLKSKDIIHEYDLISDNMTLYPVVFEKHTWYHCNILGRRRDIAHSIPTVFFVEVKCGTNYDVMACIPLDTNNCYNCKVCPVSCDILHPPGGGFICGSKEGQKIFFYTIPGKPCDNRASTLSSIGTIASMSKAAVSSAATTCSLVNRDNSSGLKEKNGIRSHALELSSDDSLNIGQKCLMGAEFFPSY